MINKAGTNQYAQVAPLFEWLSHNLSIAVVLDRMSRGWVYGIIPRNQEVHAARAWIFERQLKQLR